MFVPDDAKQRRIKDKLTPAAWCVYEAHCQFRFNARYKVERMRGLSFAAATEVAETEGLALKTVLNAMTLLRKKGWLEELPDGSVRLLVGDFSPVDKTPAKSAPATENIPQTGNLFPDLGNTIPDSGNEIPCLGKEIPQLGKTFPDLGNSAYIGSRARLQPYTSLTPANSSTHTPAATDEPPPEQAPSACVCVDELTFEDFEGYARSEGTFDNPRGWASRAFLKRAPHVLNFVRAWKARQVENDAPTASQSTPYEIAEQYVAQVAIVPGYDVDGYIERLDLDDETRERLRERYLPARGEVVARAHAPP